MEKYPTIYTDKHGRVKTSIFNVFTEQDTECLEMVIDGIPFIGSSFDSFEFKTPETYKEEQLKRFTFNKVPISGTNAYSWELCNCKIEIEIPQTIIDIEIDDEIDADLKMIISLGSPSANGGINKMSARFFLSFYNHKFVSESDSFETAFSQIQKEMWPLFRFKNCFSCHYSDYSPDGNGFFASMMCFRNNKASYLTATKKEQFFKLAVEGYVPVQETYCCSQFAPREKGTGYRGWPFE